jgi:hypothetical protein
MYSFVDKANFEEIKGNIKDTANIVGTGPKAKRKIVETKSISFRHITAHFPGLVQTL